MNIAAILAFIRSPFFKWAVSLASVIAVVAYIFHAGEMHKQMEWDADKVKTQKIINDLKAKADKVTIEKTIEYVDRVKIVTIKGDTITEYVDRYITPEEDKGCTIPNDFVTLHDGAAKNIVPKKKGAPK